MEYVCEVLVECELLILKVRNQSSESLSHLVEVSRRRTWGPVSKFLVPSSIILHMAEEWTLFG